MPYSLFGDEQYAYQAQRPNEPERIPVSMIDDIVPSQYAEQISNKIRREHRPEQYYAPPRPQVQIPQIVERFDDSDNIKELRQIKYILIGIGVLLFMLFIMSLFRRMHRAYY